MPIPLSILNDRLRKIDMEELMRQAIIDNESKLVDMNREQMSVGKNAQGKTIGYYRSLSYANYKKDIGSRSPFRVPDLKLTGDFHEGMVLIVDGNEYEFGSTDEKTGMLVERYGPIFGLTKENIREAQVINTAKLGELFKKAAGL